MSWSELAALVVPVIPPLLALAWRASWHSRLRSKLATDVALLVQVPDSYDAHRTLRALVAEEASTLKDSQGSSRDWGGVVLALVGMTALGYFVVWSWGEAGLWRIATAVAVVVLLVFAYGLGESAQPAKRDARGRRDRS